MISAVDSSHPDLKFDFFLSSDIDTIPQSGNSENESLFANHL